MKVLWFSNTPCLAEDYLHNKTMNGGFLKSLEKAMQDNVDLYIAFYYGKPITPFQYGKTHYLPIFRNTNSILYKFRTRVLGHLEPVQDINKFKEIINKVNPDVIHFHGTEGPFGIVQSISDKPSVVSIQGNITVYTLKFFSGISLLNVLKYSSLKSRLFFTGRISLFRRFKNQAYREKRIFKMTTNVIGRTDWDRRISAILSPNANYFHNDEIMRDVFYESEWQKELSDTLQIHSTTGPSLYKGIETLVHCAHLLDSCKVSFKWTVAGLHATDDIIQFATKSLKIKLSENIQFLGKVDDNKLKESILNSNIYVAISHIENSPNSLCEALLLGAPCIATHAGGTSNFINDGEDGFLIQDGDPYSMAGTILEVTKDYQLAKKCGFNARKKALLRHDKNTIVTDLLNIYERIARDKKVRNQSEYANGIEEKN